MFKNYMLTALRNIRKNKTYTLINVIGLSISIAICILIYLFVDYELGFDSHFMDKENIYRVVTHINRAEGSEHSGATPFPTAAALRTDFLEFKRSTQVYKDSEVMISVGKDRYQGDIALFTEPQFFEIFNTTWIQETTELSLGDPYTVILTEQAARKYFNDTKVIGKILNLDNAFDLHVTGVVSNPPGRTSLPYDMLISWKTLEARWDAKRLNQWDLIDNDSYTFTLLPESVDIQSLEKQFEQFEQKYMEPDYAKTWSFRLQPLADIHFNHRYGSYNYITNRKVLFTFSGIGFLILVAACINFINLSTAQAMKRAREIGMRKVLGADRAHLIRQLLGETSLFTLMAIVIALFLAENILPYLNRFLGNNIELSVFSDIRILIFLGGVLFFVTIFSGLYPAAVLTGYQPVDAFKEKLIWGGKKSSIFRNSLILIQFIISQILIVGTLVIAGQMRFVSNRNLGFHSDEILTVQVPEYEENRCESLRSRWMQNPHIRDVSFAWSAPSSRSGFQTPLEYDAIGEVVEFPVYVKMCDKRYLEVYEIPVLSGRFFARNVNDISDVQWVVSSSVVLRMGLSELQEAVGKQITVNGIKGNIIGVTGDFFGHSLRRELQPVVFFNFWPQNFREAQIRLDMKDIRGTISHIQKEWTVFFPEHLFHYEFLNDYLKSLYEKESKLMILIQSAAILSILIGCLGLFGLVSFVVHQRTKEIGIRKVLGATILGVYFMISRDFLKWVLIAILVAWPVAYYLTNRWLQEFAYRIPLSVGYFIFGGFITLATAVFVISFKIIQSSIANPVESLRYE